MKQSLPRYLTKVGVVAAVVNVVINAAVGWALYHSAARVPLVGDPSILGDTAVGGFLIGFFTLLMVLPAARREARSGRVVGIGPARPTRWREFLDAHPVYGAILAGLAVAGVGGGAAIAGLLVADIHGLATGPFLGFKVGFAGVAGTAAAVMAARTGVGSVGDAPEDDRWCADPEADVGGATYPCEYIDKGGVAVTSDRHGCSATPTWQLVVRGALDPAVVRAAVGDLLVRFPSLTTRVQSLDGVPEYARRFRYAHDPSFDVDAVFDVVDLRAACDAELEDLIRATWNRYLDQFRQPPMTLTMAITGDDECRLLFRQHHGIADGRAFIELLDDFAAYLDARGRHQEPPADRLAPVHRRSELEALGLGRWTRARYAVAGGWHLLGAVVKAMVRPLTPLVQNESNDYTGANGTVRWVIADDALEAWRAARKDMGVSLNSLLTAALFLANGRWHREMGRPLGRTNAGLPMETRPRSGFRSFANHLATLYVELRLDRDLEPAAAARSIQAQVRRQRDTARPIKRHVCERAVAAGMSMDQMQKLVFESKAPAYNLNFSNLIPLPFPDLDGPGWQVDEVLVTTPVGPRSGIVLTIIRYRGRLCFNFNYTASAVTRSQTATLARHLRDVLEEMTGYTATELPSCALDRI